MSRIIGRLNYHATAQAHLPVLETDSQLTVFAILLIPAIPLLLALATTLICG